MNNKTRTKPGRFGIRKFYGAPRAEPKYAANVAIMNNFQAGVPSGKQRVNVTHN